MSDGRLNFENDCQAWYVEIFLSSENNLSRAAVISVTAPSELITSAPSASTASRAELGSGRERKRAPPCFFFSISVKFCQTFNSSFHEEYGSLSLGGAFQFLDILIKVRIIQLKVMFHVLLP